MLGEEMVCMMARHAEWLDMKCTVWRRVKRFSLMLFSLLMTMA